MRSALVIGLIVAASLAGCSAPDVDADRALSYLEHTDAPAARLAQAAALHGKDLAHWPIHDPLLPRLGPLAQQWPDALWVGHAAAVTGHMELLASALATIDGHWDGLQFGSNITLTDDAWALHVLALAGGTDPRIPIVRSALLDAQAMDGGWSWNGGAGSVDETAWVLAALHASGGLAGTADAAWAFIQDAVGPGGALFARGIGVNCQSTALGVWAAATLGQDIGDPTWSHLARCQHAEGGFSYQPLDPPDPWVSLDAVVALAYALPR